MDSASCDMEMSAILRLSVRHITAGEYSVLHKTIVVLKLLMYITINEEAELCITSSAVVMHLVAANMYIDTLISMHCAMRKSRQDYRHPGRAFMEAADIASL